MTIWVLSFNISWYVDLKGKLRVWSLNANKCESPITNNKRQYAIFYIRLTFCAAVAIQYDEKHECKMSLIIYDGANVKKIEYYVLLGKLKRFKQSSNCQYYYYYILYWWCFYLDENSLVMVNIILISVLICGATLYSFPLWLNTVLPTFCHFAVSQPGLGLFAFYHFIYAVLLLWHKRWWRPKVDTCGVQIYSPCLQQPCAVRLKTAVSSQSHRELHISRGVWRLSVTVFRS